MALVGSGMDRIQNFVAATTLAAAAFDQSFAAIVDQVGGILWFGGASNVQPGNLNRNENFAASIAIPKSAVIERRSLSLLASDGGTNWEVGAPANTNQHRVWMDGTGRIEWVTICNTDVTWPAGYEVKAWVNGVLVATATPDTASRDFAIDVARDFTGPALLRILCYRPATGTQTVTACISRDHTS